MDKLFIGLFDYDFDNVILKDFDKEEVKDWIYEGIFYELTSKNQLKFYINKNFLFLFYKEKPYKKILLPWTKMFYKVKDDYDKYTIKFSQSYEFYDIYFLDKDDYKEFLKIICKYTIQTDFHNKYMVEKWIGKGGNARVYMVKEISTGIKYAVKAASKDNISKQKNGVLSIQNEIQIMRALDHKNIIKIIEVQESNNSLYIVIELIEGGEILASNIKIKFTDIIHIIKNILKGIKYLNCHNIMHRDLKPENILLTKLGSYWESDIKIIDLGLATKINLEEYIHKRCGTPGYVAPEILNSKNKKYDEKVDIYSIGILLITLITGKKVFNGKDYKEILNKNKESFIDLDTLISLKSVPDSLRDMIGNMVIKDPNERFSIDECLSHPFFIEYQTNSSIEDMDKINKDFNFEVNLDIKTNSIKSRINDLSNGSFICKKSNWNGKVDTLYESKNFGESNTGKKRESIYKYIQNKDTNTKRISKFKNI